jgi:TRAP-type uncharacterized transport system substrate-binding protein
MKAFKNHSNNHNRTSIFEVERKTMKNAIFFIMALFAFALSAPQMDGPAPDCDGINFATGPKGKGFSLLFTDITKICGEKVSLCEVTTAGGLDNLNALSTKEADIGLVQVDAWADMKNGDENISSLQSIMPINYNYLHIVVSSTGYYVTGEKKFMVMDGDKKQIIISRFSELRGKTVVVIGSAQLLVRKLDRQLGYNMRIIDAKDDNSAFEMVRQGKVAAAFTVSGWPSGTVKVLSQSSGLSLVPFDAPVNDPYKVKPLNYKNLAVYNNNSLGAPNVLVTRPFTGKRAANIQILQSCLMENLTELKEGKYQPAWNEVNPNGSTGGIPQFKAQKK